MEGLLLVRVGPAQAHQIACNHHINNRFNVVYLGQDRCSDFLGTTYHDFPERRNAKQVKRFIKNIAVHNSISKVIVSQKLHWYSNCVEEVAKELGLDLIWTEKFFDDKYVFDRVGLHYTRYNEIAQYSGLHKVRRYTLPKYTRIEQPSLASKEELYSKYGGFLTIIFGQCPQDMALVEYPEKDYYSWLASVIKSDKKYLFKHHPLAKTEGIESYLNVQVVDENVNSLIEAYDSFAAFSSSVIFECYAKGKTRVQTGGYHFLSGDTSKQRFSFLCNKYAIKLSSKQLYTRLTTSSEEYFQG